MRSKLIVGGSVVIGGAVEKKNILINDSRIRMVCSDRFPVDEIIHAEGLLILPGLIDCHVHMREPGAVHKEDFLTGSIACLAGGITTFLDMPNNNPPTTTASALMEKEELAKKSCCCYGFHFGSDGNNISEIKKARAYASVKVYLNETTGDLRVDKDENLKAIFSAARKISIHAEGASLEKALKLFRAINDKKKVLYCCHISRKDEVAILKKYKRANIHAEVTPHHLFLSSKDSNNAFFSMKPPLASEDDVQALWDAVKSGLISTIGTDHAPHTMDEKRSDDPPYGIPGVETMLPLLLNAVNAGRLAIGDVLRLVCENPATVFGIKSKGKIEEGYDADLVFVDMNLKKKVENSRLRTKCGWSPFDGIELKGWPVITMVSGDIAYKEGNLVKKSGMPVSYINSEVQGEDGLPSAEELERQAREVEKEVRGLEADISQLGTDIDGARVELVKVSGKDITDSSDPVRKIDDGLQPDKEN